MPATLDETYERNLQEIKETKWESAQQPLVCVTVASRPLRVEELAEILAFDFKSGAIPKLRKDWRLKYPVEAILSACSTLLSVVNVGTSSERSRVVQFSHFTVKEFLTSSRFAEKHDNISRRYHISMSAAHTFVSQACLSVLLHLDKNITSQNLMEFPLAKYAAQHWFEHARFEGVSQDAVEGTKSRLPGRDHKGRTSSTRMEAAGCWVQYLRHAWSFLSEHGVSFKVGQVLFLLEP